MRMAGNYKESGINWVKGRQVPEDICRHIGNDNITIHDNNIGSFT